MSTLDRSEEEVNYVIIACNKTLESMDEMDEEAFIKMLEENPDKLMDIEDNFFEPADEDYELDEEFIDDETDGFVA